MYIFTYKANLEFTSRKSHDRNAKPIHDTAETKDLTLSEVTALLQK